MSSYKVIAFDCDGVLFDTAESNRTYYNAIRNQLGMPGNWLIRISRMMNTSTMSA